MDCFGIFAKDSTLLSHLNPSPSFMVLQLRLLPSALFDLYAQTATSGGITLADRYGLLAAILEESLSDDERSVLDRILWAIYRGKMEILNELSAIA
jgi:hypothetical protein